jgi:hypothetical protein
MLNGIRYLRTGSLVGYCEHCNETSNFVNGWEFMDRVRYCQFLKKESNDGISIQLFAPPSWRHQILVLQLRCKKFNCIVIR